MFDSPEKLVLGLVTGMVFGFLLQKGQVARFEVIVGQFLFKDWTVVKMMGSAVIVGSIGVNALVLAELAELHIRPLQWGGILLGAVLFGVGMATLGYCPGTTVAACGEGRRDAMVGVLGMLAGALCFVMFNDPLQQVISGLGNSGKVTLPEVTGTSPWLWIGLLLAAGVAGLFIDRLQRRTSPQRTTRHASTSSMG